MIKEKVKGILARKPRLFTTTKQIYRTIKPYRRNWVNLKWIGYSRIQKLKWMLNSTSDIWDVPVLKFFKNKKRITFRNGLSFEVSWQEYLSILIILNDYGYSLEEAYGLPCFTKGKMKLIVPLNYLTVLYELNDKMYDVDFNNKVVLDAGGFTGDTAVYFASKGAKKIITYEPVPYHNKLIKMNIKLNGTNAELHEEGIGDEDGYKTIHYETLGMDFGLTSGSKQIEIRTRDARKVIEESGADIAKFDCEGAEESLIQVPNDILRRVPFYIIEVHSTQIRESIMKKFTSAKFRVVKHFSPFIYHYPRREKPIDEISVIFLSRF
jgi:FkbM family methyltransferase